MSVPPRRLSWDFQELFVPASKPRNPSLQLPTNLSSRQPAAVQQACLQQYPRRPRRPKRSWPEGSRPVRPAGLSFSHVVHCLSRPALLSAAQAASAHSTSPHRGARPPSAGAAARTVLLEFLGLTIIAPIIGWTHGASLAATHTAALAIDCWAATFVFCFLCFPQLWQPGWISKFSLLMLPRFGPAGHIHHLHLHGHCLCHCGCDDLRLCGGGRQQAGPDGNPGGCHCHQRSPGGMLRTCGMHAAVRLSPRTGPLPCRQVHCPPCTALACNVMLHAALQRVQSLQCSTSACRSVSHTVHRGR